MTSITVGRLAPVNQWDQNLLDRLFANKLYPTGIEFRRVDGYPSSHDGCVLIVPGRYWAGREAEISAAIAQYSWLLMIVTSDEESTFDIGKVDHSSQQLWLQTPRVGREYDARLIPVGFPPHFDSLPAGPPDKPLDVFMAAQCTHDRRSRAFDALARVARPKYVQTTAGFTQGRPPAEYTHLMLQAKVAPCPSGAVSPDSFRVYEALESHTIPIVDDISPAYDSRGYWERMFPDAPFPILTNYDDLPGYIDDVLADYPRLANRIAAWWIQTKRRYALWLKEDLEALGALADETRS